MTWAEESTPARDWLLFLLLAILLHVLFFAMRPGFAPPLAPPRVEIQQIDPRKLEAIREQWRKREQQLLIDKDKNRPKDEVAPKDARYMSDRNIRVEKEQRARDTRVVPKAGSPREEESKPKSRLDKLGIPLKLSPNGMLARTARQRETQREQAEPGGDQSILDDRVPEGSENLLNAQESVYYSFYSRLYEAIGPIWESRIREVPYRRRVQEGDYTTAVDVVFDEQGYLKDVRMLKPSGIPEFDAAVSDSWRKVGRFPNPPRDLLKNGELHTGWNFTVRVGSGFNLDYLPPERFN